jgi:plasmid maintenance system antidote protein VapI
LLGKALGQSPQYWLNLQTAYDLKTAARQGQLKIKRRRLFGVRLNAGLADQ